MCTLRVIALCLLARRNSGTLDVHVESDCTLLASRNSGTLYSSYYSSYSFQLAEGRIKQKLKAVVFAFWVKSSLVA